MTSTLARLRGPAACLRHGEALLARGEPRAGARLIVRAARAGHAGAALAVARLYLAGEALPPNRGEAERWFRAAAEAGHAEAQAAYAAFLWSAPALDALPDPLTVAAPPAERDAAAALRWATRAATSGVAAAEALVGQILCFGPDALRDEAAGETALRHAMQAGRADAALGLALLLTRQGRDDAAGRAECRQLFEQAAAGGAVYASYALGTMAEQDSAWADAAAHHSKAAQRGLAAAQYRLGMLMLAGRGTPRNLVDGESWLRRAALGGEAAAALRLGDFYSNAEDGLPPNRLEAAAWYHRAAEAGHVLAQYRLGRMILAEAESEAHGRLADARLWIGRAAAGGLAAAQAILGEMLLHGRGGPADRDAARDWFTRAAAQDHLGAIFALGILHASAEGAPPDFAKSEYFLRQAAEAGHLPARQEYDRLRALGLFGQGHGALADQAVCRIDAKP